MLAIELVARLEVKLGRKRCVTRSCSNGVVHRNSVCTPRLLRSAIASLTCDISDLVWLKAVLKYGRHFGGISANPYRQRVV